MKTCSYCRSTVNDGDTRCPSCGAGSFKMRCGVCGRAYEGETCPTCRQNQMDSVAMQQRAQETAAAAAKANTSLGIKTIATVFFPFIGGYFLIAPYVKSGFKIFGIIWCAIAGLGVATTANTIPVRLISSLVCLLPIAVYIVRCHNLDADQKPPKALSIILACVAAIVVVLGIVMPIELPELPEGTAGYTSNFRMTKGQA